MTARGIDRRHSMVDTRDHEHLLELLGAGVVGARLHIAHMKMGFSDLTGRRVKSEDVPPGGVC